MPFFTSHTPKPPKTHHPVFAGVDDPFNFPTTKMRYNARSASPASTTDSGYCSIDDDAPLNPKAHILSKNRRQLHKDGTGHWRVQSYEHARRGDRTAVQRDLASSLADGKSWTPDPKRTFTAMRIDGPRKEKWYTTRLYATKTQRTDLTPLQKSMAPTLRHASPAPSLALLDSDTPRSSTLRNPPAPPQRNAQRGRPRRPSASRDDAIVPRELGLRSPRNRSPTPLGIPTSSKSQPVPTPLRIRIGDRGASGSKSAESVARGRVSGCEVGDEEEHDEEDGGFESGIWGSSEARRVRDEVEVESEAESIESAVGSTVGVHGCVILARTALVARAQRVKVLGPGLARSAEK